MLLLRLEQLLMHGLRNGSQCFRCLILTALRKSVDLFSRVNAFSAKLRPWKTLLNQGTGFNGGNGQDRGANNATEFARQRAKIINAIVTISPDVAGLTEVKS